MWMWMWIASLVWCI